MDKLYKCVEDIKKRMKCTKCKNLNEMFLACEIMLKIIDNTVHVIRELHLYCGKCNTYYEYKEDRT